MVVNKRKKSSRAHGSQTHGWGRKSKHRGAGNRSGRGNCGLTGKRGHVKKPTYLKMRSVLGIPRRTKVGFKRNAKVVTEVRAIGLYDVCRQLDALVAAKKATKEKDTYVVNLADLGYNKLLANGSCSVKLKVTTLYFSQRAREKIEAAGGSVASPLETAPAEAKEAPAKAE